PRGVVPFSSFLPARGRALESGLLTVLHAEGCGGQTICRQVASKGPPAHQNGSSWSQSEGLGRSRRTGAFGVRDAHLSAGRGAGTRSDGGGRGWESLPGLYGRHRGGGNGTRSSEGGPSDPTTGGTLYPHGRD